MEEHVDTTRLVNLGLQMVEYTVVHGYNEQGAPYVVVPKEHFIAFVKELEELTGYEWHDLRETDEAQDS